MDPCRGYRPDHKAPASSVVDRVLLTANETDQFLVKVMVRQCRRPEVGDKHDTGSCAKLETFTWYCYRLSILGLQVGMARKASAVQSCHRSNMIHPGWIGDVSFYEISNKFTCAITLGGYAIFWYGHVSWRYYEPSWVPKPNDCWENNRTCKITLYNCMLCQSDASVAATTLQIRLPASLAYVLAVKHMELRLVK